VKKPRSPDLTAKRVEEILDILDVWEGKLTWNLLLESYKKSSGVLYSRFTLLEHAEIANAFDLRKKSPRFGSPATTRQSKDVKLQTLENSIHRLHGKVERLSEQNALFHEQFVTWALNAQRQGVTMEMLNAPLPKPDRDRTKGSK
jgi:hypothetical protein